MADFKLKPGAGTGNKLILESQDGTDVLTTSDSGVTLASATLNSPTLVTPALGTPASGVLTNATFPVGHVIQVVSSSSSAYGSTNVQSYQLGHRQGITPLKNTSKLYVTITSNFLGYRDQAARWLGYCAIWRDTDATILRSSQCRGDGVTANNGEYFLATIDIFDNPTIPSTPVEILYGVAIKTESTNSLMYFDDGGPCTVTIMEISQ